MMAQALRLAEQGQYTARPNPMVGCVIVKDGHIIGQGFHRKAGEEHAEINALAEAGDNAKGATCYVTLEPCAHVGRTGACADALVKAGVAKVIAAINDPNPLVAGKGFEKLETAGIETSAGLLSAQALELNQGFIKKFEQGLPKVSLKLAMSLDGRTALANGESKWITGPQARNDVQKLRARQDAIITGIGTQMADNPSMTCRAEDASQWFNEQYKFEQPRRILLDSKARAVLTDKFFQQHPNDTNSDSVWWMTEQRETALSSMAADYEHIKLLDKCSLSQLLKSCADSGFNQVLVEAGHQLSGAFIEEGLVDEIIVYVAPKLMGNNAMGLLALNVESMKNCPPLKLIDVRQLGDDLRLTYIPLSLN
jgi:diaminohydroxyphosphoribosylaminopyrimidine deaminase/5-amino-6-(5-phosphoribosylamino)uracil reductase